MARASERRHSVRRDAAALSPARGSAAARDRQAESEQKVIERAFLLPLWEKADCRKAARRMRGAGRNEALAILPTPLIRPSGACPRACRRQDPWARTPSPTRRGEGQAPTLRPPKPCRPAIEIADTGGG